MKQVTFTIDGQQIKALPGQTILQAALEHGITIPYMCWHPKLDPIGSCRVCVVRVNGDNRLVASCQVPVAEGMVVESNQPDIIEERRKALALALVDHPLDCGLCDKSGECDLQNRTIELHIEAPLYPSVGYYKGIDQLSPLIELCNTRCIGCSRCIQICQQIQGARAIDYVVQAGSRTVVGQTTDDGFLCESCGQCISVCPCGVILDKTFKQHARAFEMKHSIASCPYCSLGCLIYLNRQQNRIFRVTPVDQPWFNNGFMCVLGRFGWDTSMSDPHAMPALKEANTVTQLTADAAVEQLAQKLASIRDKYSGNAIAVIADTTFCNEDYHLLQALARSALGSPNVQLLDIETSLAARIALKDAFGIIASPAGLPDLRTADAALVVNSDIVDAFPVVTLDMISALRASKTDVMALGYRVNKLSKAASKFIRNKPGSDYVFMLGVIKALLYNPAFDARSVSHRFTDLTTDKTKLANLSETQFEEYCGVPYSHARDVADRLLKAKQPIIVLSISGVTEGFHLPRLQTALYLASLLASTAGAKPPLLCLYNGSNVQGALEAGMHPDFLPGFKSTDNRGKDIASLLSAIAREQIKGIVLLGEGLVRTMQQFGFDPQSLKKAELFAVLSPYSCADKAYANLHIPVAAWGETTGNKTTIYKNIVKTKRAVMPPPQTKSASEIVSSLLTLLAGPDGISVADDHTSGKLIPNHPGEWDWLELAQPTPLSLPKPTPHPEAPTLAFPYILRIRQYLGDAMPLSEHSHNILPIKMNGVVEINAGIAQKLGVSNGDQLVVVTTSGTRAKAIVLASNEIPPSLVALHDYALWHELLPAINLEKWYQEGVLPEIPVRLEKV